jgi:ElaB/YqjD/DUF883 family membrane-anchored ribosome-binding protein
MKREAEDRAREAEQKAREATEQARERVTELTSRAQEQLDQGRERAAAGLDRAATLLKERGASGTTIIGRDATEKVAHTVEHAADYLQTQKPRDLVRDASRYAKQHPWITGIGAVVLLFLISRVLR